MQIRTSHISEDVGTPQKTAVVGVYDSQRGAEKAVRKLLETGFDGKKLAIVGKNYYTEEGVVSYYTRGGRVKAWGKTGAFWGALWGLRSGSAFLVVPSIGSLSGPAMGRTVGVMGGQRRSLESAYWPLCFTAPGFPKTASLTGRCRSRRVSS